MNWLAAAPAALAFETLLAGAVALLRRRSIGSITAVNWAAASVLVAGAATQLERLTAAGLMVMTGVGALLFLSIRHCFGRC